MIRSVRISLSLATDSKKRRLDALLREFRSAANFYAQSLWKERGALDAKTKNRFTEGSLTYRQRIAALRLALQTVINACKSASKTFKRIKCPQFRRAVKLSSSICWIEKGRGCFDYAIKISSLVPRDMIVIPFKSHARLNYWLEKGGKILNGAIVGKDCAWIWIEVPDEPLKKEGDVIGLDTGFKKLLTDSNGNVHGAEIKYVCDDVRRKKPGSEGKARAIRARQDYVNFVCRRLPWQTTKTFVLEDLTGMKTGKGNRSKRNRKLLAPWSYRQVRTRLETLAPENRVGLEFVSPKFTSRTCPKCGLENAKNRVGEIFRCLRCNYTADADYIGAVNILAKTTGNCPEPMVPVGACGS